MNKDKINSKIEDLEAELQKLKKLAQEPERRTPEISDVYEGRSGALWIIGSSANTVLKDGKYWKTGDVKSGNFAGKRLDGTNFLGKFDEVFVKISAVRDALNTPTQDGLKFLSPESGINYANNYDAAREALAKLGITNQ